MKRTRVVMNQTMAKDPKLFGNFISELPQGTIISKLLQTKVNDQLTILNIYLDNDNFVDNNEDSFDIPTSGCFREKDTGTIEYLEGQFYWKYEYKENA